MRSGQQKKRLGQLKEQDPSEKVAGETQVQKYQERPKCRSTRENLSEKAPGKQKTSVVLIVVISDSFALCKKNQFLK